MGRPKPGADISIGNLRRIPAIRKTQTEAEDHKKNARQQGANQALARRNKRINQNRDRGERRKRDFFSSQQATTAEKPLRASL